MSKRVAVGVVSTSWWAELVHLPALAGHQGTDLAAICGRNYERATEMGVKYGIRGVYTDYREMLEKVDLDALVVAVPDDMHHQVTMDALASGLHVVCEKPLASTAEQARDMYETAEAAGVKHMTFYTWRWMPSMQFVKERIREGFIGTPYTIQAHFYGSFGRYTDYQWRFDRRRANGVLGDLGSHVIDLARWYIGDIAKVNAHLTSFVNRSDNDGRQIEGANDSALLILQFENRAHGQIQASAVSHTGNHGIEIWISIHGELGMLELNFNLQRGEVHGARHDEEDIKRLHVDEFMRDGKETGPLTIFTDEAVGNRYFIDCIVEDRPVSPTFFDGWRTQQVIDAAIDSQSSGKWVDI